MKNISQAWDEYLEYSKRNNVATTYRFKSKVRDYVMEVFKVMGCSIEFESIDNKFFNSYIQYCQSKGYSDNTTGKYVKGVKEFVNWSIESQIANRKFYGKVSVAKVSRDIVVYNEQELQSIIDLDLSDNKRLEEARDIMIIGCFTGLRVSDLLSIENTNVKESYLKVTPKKTEGSGKTIEIPLSSHPKRVFEKYKGRHYKYALPIMTKQKLTYCMREIGDLVGISGTEEVRTLRGGKMEVKTIDRSSAFSPHRMRATFITIMLKAGVPAEQVMDLSGHKSYQSFQKYIKFSSEDNKKSIEKAFGGY